MNEIINLFPHRLRENIKKYNFEEFSDIRLSAEKPGIFSGKEREVVTGFLFKKEDIKNILAAATENSLYSYQEDIKEGFITIKGGHRMGVAGRAITENGRLFSVEDISFVNIRLAREIKGAAKDIMPHILKRQRVFNTLIISPPGKGKTTLLRDIGRILGNTENMRPAIIDSRFEIGAHNKGMPTMDIGLRSFLLSGYKKNEGFSHAVRSLSSTVVLCDEIEKEDFCHIDYAINSGVSVIATAHGNSYEEAEAKFDLSGFKKFIILKEPGGRAEII